MRRIYPDHGSEIQSIIHELKCAKYFSVSIDSTPDITDIDQLTCVLFYVLDDGPVECEIY